MNTFRERPNRISGDGILERLFIGIVRNGLLQLVLPRTPQPDRVRLTRTRPQDCVPPELGELNLIEYEASAIAVQGHNLDGWIYSARVVDTGDPIVTVLVESVLGG